DHGHIHSQPFSEGVKTGALEGYSTTATPVDGGYRVSGVKIFASLADAADFHNVLAMVPDDDQVHFLGVPADADGVTIEGEWDPLGMRGTVSKNLVMQDVFVPAENEWLPAGGFNQAAERWPFMYLTLSFTFLGLMQGAIDFTRDYLIGKGGEGERREIPQKQQGWAEMLLKHEQAQSLTYRVMAEMHRDPEPELVKRSWAAVVATMETAPEVAALAIRVCGGRSLLKPLALERIYRDARCGATMLPWSVDVCLERLGRYDLFDEAVSPA
ncbi:MAG: acyl-CoA dehydrogenase, partial [Acidimicrobiia bacterium]